MTDDLDLGIEEKFLTQGINMCSIKTVSVTIQKLWSILKFFADKHSNGPTDRTKLYAPIYQ